MQHQLDLKSFNNYLEKCTDHFSESIKSLDAKSQWAHLDLMIIALRENKMLFYKKNINHLETFRLIQKIYKIHSLAKYLKVKNSVKILKKVTMIAKEIFSAFGKGNVEQSLLKMTSLKSDDETFFYQMLASWISGQKIPIRQLKLLKEEILNLAPWLTYLDLTDASDEECSDCVFSDEFVGKLLGNSKKLQHLRIKNSLIDGSFFASFKNTNKLQHLIIMSCPELNHPLPNQLKELKTLVIDACSDFNQKLPKDLPSLQELRVVDCDMFDQELPEKLLSLRTLAIDGCYSFNKNLPKIAPKLKTLLIWNCDCFNQELPQLLPNLETLTMGGCSAFRPFELSFCTLSLLTTFDPGTFQSDVENRDGYERNKKKCLLLNNSQKELEVLEKEITRVVTLIEAFGISRKEFLLKYPNFKIPFDLNDLEEFIKKGGAQDVLQKRFLSLKNKSNFGDYLKKAIYAFPSLTSFLVRHCRNDIIEEIKKVTSPQNTALQNPVLFLPLLSPDQICSVIVNTQKKVKEEWLRASLKFESISGKVAEVLKIVREKNLNKSSALLDNLLYDVQDLLKKIPLKTLAAFASIPNHTETILDYRFAMNDTELSVVIPQITESALIEYLKKQSIPIHKEILNLATTKQKKAYIEEDLLLTFSPLNEWQAVDRHLKSAIANFRQDPTNKKYHQLQMLWATKKSRLHINIFKYEALFSALEQILPKYCISKEYQQMVKKYLDSKKKIAQKARELVNQMGVQMENLSKMVKDKESKKIPENFIDPLTCVPMKDPWSDERGFTADKSTWDKCKKIHPITRLPFTITPNLPLKKKIVDFFEKYPKL